MKKLALVVVGLFAIACGRGKLTAKEADAIVLKQAGGIAVISTEAVSTTSDTEAITRTRIGENVLNLKFRRYDDGWRWEFAETKAGGWIAADEVLKQVREELRAQRGAVWAKSHAEEYRRTVLALDIFSEGIPGRPDYMDAEHWTALRHVLANVYRDQSILARIESPGERAYRAAAAAQFDNPAPKDAWGRDLLLHFDSSNHTATFLSAGLDVAPEFAREPRLLRENGSNVTGAPRNRLRRRPCLKSF